MKVAIIEFENGELIKIELFEKDAPNTVANFEKLANSGFYDGIKFHRVIKDFVAQGGDPTGTGMGGPGYKIDCELIGNPNKHLPGALSMAHAGRNTGGSQFFLCHVALPHLDGNHTVFGQTFEGMDVILRIKQGDVMKSVKVIEE